MTTTIYIINSHDDFHKYFKYLKEDAMVGDGQKVYVIGLDTEFICKDNYPESFARSSGWLEDNESCKMAMCTIQVASNSVCLVINLVNLMKPLPKKLVTMLTSDSWVKFGIGIENDLRILSLNYKLGHCSGSIELKSLALMANHPKPNLEHLYNQFIGGHVKKTDSVHDWSKELTDEQISYAARDAIMSYQLGMRIMKPTLDTIVKVIQVTSSNKLKINIGNDDLLPKKIEKSNDPHINYVGRLNEYAQWTKITLPKYDMMSDKSSHPIKFNVTCHLLDKETSATGLSKQEAKTISAKLMLELLN